MVNSHHRFGVAVAALVFSALPARDALAISAFEVPDNGTQQLSRGGAWVARASTPLATFYNPAALSGLDTAVTIGSNINFYKVCVTRTDENGDPEEARSEGLALVQGGLEYPETCNENSGDPQVIPSLGLNYRLTPDLGVGFSIIPPSVLGPLKFPETVTVGDRNGSVDGNGSPNEYVIPSPQRYQILEAKGILVNFTLGVGYDLGGGFRVGGGFVWGFGKFELSNAAMALPSRDAFEDDPSGDVKADVSVMDPFIPGGVFGAMYSPTPNFDFGFSAFIQDHMDAKGDLTAASSYWTATQGTTGNPVVADSAALGDDLVTYRMANPWNFRVGGVFRLPRNGAPGYSVSNAARDPLEEDVFDIELDLEYTRNSMLDAIEVRTPKLPEIQVFSRDQDTGDVTPLSRVPENVDMPLKLKDTWGFRLGGDYVISQGTAAVRGGIFYMSKAANDEYLTPIPVGSSHFGVSVGGQYRVSDIDIELGAMKMFSPDLENKGKCLPGEQCGGKGKIRAVAGSDPLGNRSPYTINGGKVSLDALVFSLSVTKHFR